MLRAKETDGGGGERGGGRGVGNLSLWLLM